MRRFQSPSGGGLKVPLGYTAHRAKMKLQKSCYTTFEMLRVLLDVVQLAEKENLGNVISDIEFLRHYQERIDQENPQNW